MSFLFWGWSDLFPRQTFSPTYPLTPFFMLRGVISRPHPLPKFPDLSFFGLSPRRRTLFAAHIDDRRSVLMLFFFQKGLSANLRTKD